MFAQAPAERERAESIIRSGNERVFRFLQVRHLLLCVRINVLVKCIQIVR